MSWPNRIKERTMAKAADLLDHEGNWRIHPDAQKAGMVGVLDEVGIVDALTVYNYAKRYKSVQEAIDRNRGHVIDTAEVALFAYLGE